MTPIQVNGLNDVTAITSSNSHSLAVKSDGTLWSWGYNYHGELGDGTTVSRSSPVPVS